MNVIFNPQGFDPVRHLRVLVGAGLANPTPGVTDIVQDRDSRHTVTRMSDRQVIYADASGELILTTEDGSIHLRAIDANGQTVFEGPVNTPEERSTLSPEIREKLMHLESQRDLRLDMDSGTVRILAKPGAGPI
jgi:hypothetical protein